MKIRLDTSILIDVDLPDDLANQLNVQDGQVGLADEGDDGPHHAFNIALARLLDRAVSRLDPTQFVSSDWINWSPVCRECGCTDDEACLLGCTWVERDLCSSHQPAPAP